MPGKPARRRITKAKITHISLVPRGANQMRVVYKSDTDTAEFDTLIKDDMLEEHGELTAIVYAPEVVDSQGDVASADVIKEMAYEFAKSGLGSIDLKHDGKDLSRNDAWVAESFLVSKSDAKGRFSEVTDYSGQKVDLTGAWAVVIKIDNPDLRQLYRDGKWDGVSMFGNATVKAASEDSKPAGVLKALAKALGLAGDDIEEGPEAPTGEPEMAITEADIKKMLDERDTTLVQALTKSMSDMLSRSQHSADILKAAGVTESDSPEVVNLKVELHKAKQGDNADETGTGTQVSKSGLPKPEFKGDASDEAAVEKFEYEVAKWEILKEMDSSDPKSVKQTNAALAKLDEQYGDLGDEDEETTSLRHRLTKAERRSNLPADNDGIRLSKEDREAFAAAAEMAARANGDEAALRKMGIVA